MDENNFYLMTSLNELLDNGSCLLYVENTTCAPGVTIVDAKRIVVRYNINNASAPTADTIGVICRDTLLYKGEKYIFRNVDTESYSRLKGIIRTLSISR